MDLLAQLNPRQREAVEHVDGPLLILAGAGSGKTRVITYRIAYLIRQCGLSPARLLAVTFTNKAAAEMRDRVAALLGPGAATPVLSTFHSLAVRILRQHGASLQQVRPGFTPRFTIYDEGDQLSVVKSVYKDVGLDEKTLAYKAALGKISDAKSERVSPQQYYQWSNSPLADKMAVIYDHYETALRRANALDFDDLLLETVRLLGHDDQVRQRLIDRFHYLMVDEYQDTNRTQYELTRLLTEPRRNLCVVGDEDQSIYSWRGADIRNILDFERDYPGAAVIRLEQNYRSTKNILDAAGAVVARNEHRKGKTLWTESGAGTPILFYTGEDTENEALFVAEYVQKYLSRNPQDRAAVLYRTNFQSRQIEEALRRYGRKYTLVGGLSFYQRAEVKDALAYLKAALSAPDTYSLLRIINTPARGIGRTTVEQIEAHARERGIGAWEAIEELLGAGVFSARAQAAVGVFRDLMVELRDKVAAQPVHEALVWLLDRTGYKRTLEQEDSIESRGRLENLNELLNAARDAAEREETVHEFLDHAALIADTDDLEESAQVTLLTLHSAKGLEFHLVIMAGMEEGIFPHSRSLSLENAAGLEEERRLCYVGMTRAQKQLVLTRARFRRRYGGGELAESEPSRFFDEVPRDLVEDLTPVPRGRRDVDLYAEQQEVRHIARRTTFTGKTYNSVENVAEFFAGRDRKGAVPSASPAPPKVIPIRSPGGSLRAGVRVRHPKYGAGVILRREGDGDEVKLTVSFPHHGLKKLMEKYATLTLE